MSDEAEEIVDLLRANGYDAEILDGTEFPLPSVPITEAVKDAPKHWP